MNRILILGYYNRNNLGDEQYKLSFKKLFPFLQKYFLICKNIKKAGLFLLMLAF